MRQVWDQLLIHDDPLLASFTVATLLRSHEEALMEVGLDMLPEAIQRLDFKAEQVREGSEPASRALQWSLQRRHGY